MSTEAGRVHFTIGAEADKADKEVKRSFGDMAKSAVKLAAAIYVAKKAFDLITSTFSEAIKLADFADTTTGNLAAAFVRAGVDARAATGDFLKFADSMQMMTGISDETFQEMGALGASFGILGDDLKQTTLLSADMAKVMKIDVQRVMAMVARSVDSGTNAMIRYGIEMSSSSDKAVRLSSILENMNAKFGGAAQAAAASYGVRMKVIAESYGDLNEELGRSITQSKTWNALIEESTKGIRGLQAELKSERGWLEGWISGLLSVAGAVEIALLHVAETVIKGFHGIVAGANLALATLMEVPKLLPLIQLGFAKMADGAIGDLSDLAEAISALPGPIGMLASDAMVALEGLRSNIAANEKVARDSMANAEARIQVFLSSAADELAAIDETTVAYAEKRKTIEDYIAAVRDAAAVIVVDPIEGALGGKKGGAGKPPADDSTVVAAENYVSIWDLAFQQMKDLYAADQLAAKEAEEAKQAQVMAVTTRMADSYGTMFGAMLAGTEESGEAVKRMALSSLSIIKDMVIKAIMAHAALAAAEAASSQAAIPVVGPILAVGAATAMFALVRAYLTRMHEGGIVGGSGSSKEVPILAERGEMIFPVDVTRQLLASGRRRQIPALAGGGGGSVGGGDTFVANLYSFMPGQNTDLMNATREQERMRDKMRRRGVIEGDGGDT